jgi:hypothetical protein
MFVSEALGQEDTYLLEEDAKLIWHPVPCAMYIMLLHRWLYEIWIHTADVEFTYLSDCPWLASPRVRSPTRSTAPRFFNSPRFSHCLIPVMALLPRPCEWE